jgi:hypothetical protein
MPRQEFPAGHMTTTTDKLLVTFRDHSTKKKEKK